MQYRNERYINTVTFTFLLFSASFRSFALTAGGNVLGGERKCLIGGTVRGGDVQEECSTLVGHTHTHTMTDGQTSQKVVSFIGGPPVPRNV